MGFKVEQLKNFDLFALSFLNMYPTKVAGGSRANSSNSMLLHPELVAEEQVAIHAHVHSYSQLRINM